MHAGASSCRSFISPLIPISAVRVLLRTGWCSFVEEWDASAVRMQVVVVTNYSSSSVFLFFWRELQYFTRMLRANYKNGQVSRTQSQTRDQQQTYPIGYTQSLCSERCSIPFACQQ